MLLTLSLPPLVPTGQASIYVWAWKGGEEIEIKHHIISNQIIQVHRQLGSLFVFVYIYWEGGKEKSPSTPFMGCHSSRHYYYLRSNK